MTNSPRFASSLWVRGALVLGLACSAAFIAREQGWLAWLPGSKPTRPFRHTVVLDGIEDDVPDPVEAYEGEPSDGIRHSHWSGPGRPRLKRDESLELEDRDAIESRVTTAGFEEEAPPAPSKSDDASDDASRDGNSSAANTAAVARRPSESSQATFPLRIGETGSEKAQPLLDRGKIEDLIDKGNYIDAQKELSKWFWKSPTDRATILPDLNRLSKALYFSAQPHFYDAYTVKPGDQLRVVGQRYKLSWEYLAKLNHVDPKKIRMGQKLKVVPGPFAAAVFLDRYELIIHLNGSFVKSYRVGVGKDGTTPLGTFTVKNKMVDPTYYGSEGVIAHDDPKNPLGERWVDIGDSYGIHGTIDPESIGKNESRGCIRMLNSEVEEVYDFLVIGSEVKIQK